ncbi:ABC-type branched-chain amino acid transport systems, periplasmic component [hydrothermal vent metagenome]|uniref:ABC-type branched-chain amino acid transport systems, periplasmic component n=1 Tax=hydrothermal vent metagenome TaxID=652676 RepID=A0A3B0ZXD6_9ZZZZ
MNRALTNRQNKTVNKKNTKFLFNGIIFSLLSVSCFSQAYAVPGVSSTKITIGGVMDLEGRSKALGSGMKMGISAAIRGKKIKGKSIEFITLNDSYNPEKSIAATNELIDKKVFLVIGNVGTPTAKVTLPILAKNNIPAVGFFTGAGLLRPGKGDIINYRASYVQETAYVINSALRAGVKTNQICAYVQNDAYGMAGVTGIKRALIKKSGTKKIIALLNQIIAMPGTNPKRNGIGPVGVYQRNTFSARAGYLSLKNWEKISKTRCRLVLTVGAYTSVAGFIGYANMKKENWVYSAVSFTGATNLKNILATYGVHNKVIVTEVVPPLNSKLKVVAKARKLLGKKFSSITLEGYLVGRMMLAIMEKIPGKIITRQAFISAAKSSKFNIDGVTFDFTSDNQASDLITPTYLKNGIYHTARRSDFKRLFE